MNEKYKEIINMPHPVSQKHKQMDRLDRAAQFAPYSALSGYEDSVEETARLTDRKTELDDYEFDDDEVEYENVEDEDDTNART